MQAAVSFASVSKRYGRKVQALSDITFQTPRSEVTGIIGADGAGKSTLMKIASAILTFEGEASVFGMDLRHQAEACKRRLSFMPQGIGLNLYMDLSVAENIAFFGAIKGVPESEISVLGQRLLDATGLGQFGDRLARNLSGGMKQKLGLCCSLLSRPELLMLDEPSTGIDPLSRRQLWAMLGEFIRESGTSVLLSSSYMDEAERCHWIGFFDDGRLLRQGSPEELIGSAGGLEETFFTILREERGERRLPHIPSRQSTGGAAVPEAISANGLTKRFGEFTALDEVSFHASPGEVVCLLGPNGAGKTTLIKCMIGLLGQDSGEVTVLGLDPRSRGLKERIGYMSQIFSLYGDLTVAENIELYGVLYGVKGRALAERSAWVLEVAGLHGKQGAIVGSLPLGMKQRLALGCATLHLPEILFLDEPTSGVDPLARRSFWDLIKGLARGLGITVVVTTHNLVEADYCDRVVIMNEGRVVAEGTPEGLKDGFSRAEGKVFEILPGAGDMPVGTLGSSGIRVMPVGRRYHLWKKGLGTEEIRGLMASSDVEVRGLQEIPPPMEDVFIHYLGKSPGQNPGNSGGS